MLKDISSGFGAAIIHGHETGGVPAQEPFLVTFGTGRRVINTALQHLGQRKGSLLQRFWDKGQ